MAQTLTLQHGPLALSLAPGRGAACTALTWSPPGQTPVDLWRPMPSQAEVFEAACFVLVPYSNRLFGGRLLAQDAEHALPRNHGRVEQAVHGLGWRQAWRLLERGRAQARLGYRHRADAHWPYDHSAEQSLTVREDGLRLHLTLTNLDRRSMPAGLGWHPRFALDAGDRVRWDARGEQAADRLALNDCFGPWRGAARLDRRSRGLRLRLRAGASLSHLMVFRLPDQPWLCLEPVSHATGAFSLPALRNPAHGARDLAPGRTLRAWIDLRIEPRAFPFSPSHPPRRPP